MQYTELELQTKYLSVRIQPAMGGKVTSLYDKRHSHEWLWSNPHLESPVANYNRSYIRELDTGGLDEVLPSVDPLCTELPGCGLVKIPDHGDLVRLPWEVEEQSEAVIRMGVSGMCLPFRFQRTLKLRDRSVEFQYRLVNTGTCAFPCLWCLHPLVPLENDLRVIPPERAFFKVAAALGESGIERGTLVRWNDLPPFSAGAYAVKLFSEAGIVDTCSLRSGSGASLRMDWNAQAVPFLGIWLNNGYWSGCGSEPYRNIGIEPTTWAADTPEGQSLSQYLQPGEVREWMLTVTLNEAIP